MSWFLKCWLVLLCLSTAQAFALHGESISKIDASKLLRLTSKSKIYCYRPQSKAIAGFLIREKQTKKQIKTWISFTKAKRLRVKAALKIKKSARKLNVDCEQRFRSIKNDVPTAIGQTITTSRDLPIQIFLTGSDPEDVSLQFTLTTSPQHGTLSGTSPNLTYTPEAMYLGQDSFEFTASDGTLTSDAATVRIFVGDYLMPLGLPTPAFGLNENYRMYDDPTVRNSQLNYTQNAEGGFYTHYVDNSLPDCASNPQPCSTDENNDFGTASKARQTVPESLKAGSVVEIHGTLYTYSNGPSGEVLAAGVGTQQQPIFIRGANANGVKPIFTKEWGLGYYEDARYMIFENIHGHGWGVSGRRDGVFETSYIALRNSEFEGDVNDSGGIGIASYTTNTISNILIYNSAIHENGIWDPNQATGDRDFHGITIGGKVSYVWVLDCTLFHNEGDGLQLNSDPADFSHHIYLGRNVSHHNKQAGFGLKYARDVIVSENTVFGHRPSSSASGAGIGEQYGPVRTWFLFNHLYDNETGFIINSTSGPGFDGEGDGTYFIGNVLHNIHHSSSTWNPSGGPDCIEGSAFCLRANDNRYVIGNTIYDVNAGISMLGTATVENNIVSNISEIAYAHHLRMDASTLAISNASIANNLFYQSGDASKIRIIAGPNYNSPLTLNSFKSINNCSGCLDTTNPEFVDAAINDFSLKPSSGARNAGRPTTIEQLATTFQSLYGVDIKVDLNRVARPQEGAWDIGAYEVSP